MSSASGTTSLSAPRPSLDGLHFIDTDPASRKLRKIMGQIFAFDYLILKSYSILIRNLPGNKSQNPYAFVASKTELGQIESFCGGIVTGLAADLCSAFKIYTISISLQKIFTYVFMNPQQFDGLQTIDIGRLSDLLTIDGTADKISPEDKEYLKVTRDNTAITQLEIANSGTTLKSEEEKIILAIIDALGDLSNNGDETRIPDQYREVETEFEREVNLLTALFQGVGPTGAALTVDDVIHAAGLETLFKKINEILPDEVYEIYESPILEGSIEAWRQFFTQQNTQIIDMLVSTLPTIPDRFANVTATPTPTPTSTLSTVISVDSQQDYRYNGQRLMADFLDGALLPVRLDELTNLSNNPSAVTFLKVFRSLLVLPDTNQKLGIWFSEPGGGPNITDPHYRLSFLYIIYWLLTPLRELNVLFKFATTRLDPTKYGLVMSKVVPASIFPGNLDTGTGLQISGISIQSDFDNDSRNMGIKQNKIARSGQLAATLNADDIRWFI